MAFAPAVDVSSDTSNPVDPTKSPISFWNLTIESKDHMLKNDL
jgi:hypothetical protein